MKINGVECSHEAGKTITTHCYNCRKEINNVPVLLDPRDQIIFCLDCMPRGGFFYKIDGENYGII
jgi:hypothetical protein